MEENIIDTYQPNIRVLDGHLVDVQGTLIQGNALNKPLYEAMLKTQEKGDKVFIYSSYVDSAMLQHLGIDTEKFPAVSKENFQNNLSDEKRTYTVVTGKVIDDKSLEQQGLNIILTDQEHGYEKPFAKEYSFTKTPISGKLKSYVRKKAEERLKIKQREKMRAEPISPEEERIKAFKTAEERLIRDRAGEAYHEELRKNPTTTKTKKDFIMPLSPEDKAKLHLGLRIKELQKKKEKLETNDKPAIRKKIPKKRVGIFLSPAAILDLTDNKLEDVSFYTKASGRGE